LKNEDKTKKQLINELAGLRQRITELEASEANSKQAEEALKKSEKRYRDLVDNALARMPPYSGPKT
jgi:prefoldin subunit 5